MAKKKAVTKNIPSETPIPILDTNVDYTIKVVCKNEKQKSFVNSIKNIRKEICFGVGSAGKRKKLRMDANNVRQRLEQVVVQCGFNLVTEKSDKLSHYYEFRHKGL